MDANYAELGSFFQKPQSSIKELLKNYQLLIELLIICKKPFLEIISKKGTPPLCE